MFLEEFPFGHLRLDPPRRYYCDPNFASELGSQRLEEVYQGSIGSLNTNIGKTVISCKSQTYCNSVERMSKSCYIIEAHSRNRIPSCCRSSDNYSPSAPFQVRECSKGCLNWTPEVHILKKHYRLTSSVSMDRYHPWINNQAKELEFSEYYKLGTVIFDIWNLLKRPHARDASIAHKMVHWIWAMLDGRDSEATSPEFVW